MQPGEFLVIQASKTTGVVSQKGLLVVRPTYVTFVPTEGAVNALGMVGAALGGIAVGMIVRVVPGEFPDVRSYLFALVGEPADAFDAHVAAIWQRAGWWYGAQADTTCTFKKTILFGRYSLYFRRGKDHVGPVFGLKKELAARVEPIVAAWAQAAAAAKI